MSVFVCVLLVCSKCPYILYKKDIEHTQTGSKSNSDTNIQEKYFEHTRGTYKIRTYQRQKASLPAVAWLRPEYQG